MELNLYNYMPLPFVRSMFAKGLYFRLASKFEDQQEGAFPEIRMDLIQGDLQCTADSLGLELTPQRIKELSEFFDSLAQTNRKQIFINCWHENTQFSPEMWGKYAKGGAYIKTNAGLILQSIPREALCVLEYDGSRRDGLFTQVNYVPTLSGVTDDDARLFMKTFLAYNRKTENWSFEREYRMLINAIRFSTVTGRSINGVPPVSGIEDLHANVDEVIKIEPEDGAADTIFIKVDASILVQEIGIVGRSNHNEILSLCEDLGISDSIITILDESVAAPNC